MSLEDAQARVSDSATSAAELAEIAQHYPQLHNAVRRHPNAYPALVDWIDRATARLPSPEVSILASQRTANRVVQSGAATRPVKYSTRRGSGTGAPVTGIILMVLGILSIMVGRRGELAVISGVLLLVGFILLLAGSQKSKAKPNVVPQARTVMVVDPTTGEQVPMLLADSATGTNVLAILSLVFCAGPLGLVFGHVALSQIKKSG